MSHHTLATTLQQYGLDERGHPVDTQQVQGVRPSLPVAPPSPAPVGLAALAVLAALGLLFGV